MGRTEDSPRPAPKIIQDVFDAKAAEEQKRSEEEARRVELREFAKGIRGTVVNLMRPHIPDPDTLQVTLPPRRTIEQIALESPQVMRELNRRMNLSRRDSEAEDYKFRVRFPVVTEKGEVNVDLLTTEYLDPRSRVRIDVDILPYTFDITSTGKAYTALDTPVIDKVSKQDKFSAPGQWSQPEYVHAVDLDKSDEIKKLLEFLVVGVSNGNIIPQNMTADSAIREVALNRLRVAEPRETISE